MLIGTPFRVGELEILPVSDGIVRFDATSFFNTTTDADWEVEAHRQFLDEDGRLTLSIGCFLVRSPDRTVLVDCGLRFNDGDAWQGGRLAEALEAAKVSPDDIDEVVLTHLHFDHIGWTAVRNGDEATAFFPRATYRCHEADLAWHPEVFADTYAHQIEPILDRFEPFDGDARLAPGVSVIAAPGHTPGHSVVVVSSGGERALLLGDAIHCPVQLTQSDWSMMGDFDPALAVRTRDRLLRELDGETIVGAAHFPGLRFGRVLTATTDRTWVPLSS